MRSIAFTLLLAFVCVVTVGLAAFRLRDGNLTPLLGVPVTQVGQSLYDFPISEIHAIEISTNTGAASVERTASGWRLASPWNDRVDPRVVQTLIDFTLQSRVESAIPSREVESSSLGYEDARIHVRIADRNNEPLAKYVIGQRTAWVGTDAETKAGIPTVFVEPRDRSRKDYIYAVTDPDGIHHALGEGLARVRDHHPFLFLHPNFIQTVRLKNRSGELLLQRSLPEDAWQIAKPLHLKADRAALIRLLQGLYDLEGLRVFDRSEVTLPAIDATGSDEIAIRLFGQESETTLTLYPAASAAAATVFATVSDRPNAVFELPRQPLVQAESRTLPGVESLPLTVNELRDPTLTSIDVRQLQAIRISPAASEDLLIARDAPDERFRVEIEGKSFEPNETALFSLLKTVTESRVESFVSDTVTSLKPHGLDSPFLTLRFLAFDQQVIQIDFGEAPDGSVRAMRSGTTTVVTVPPSLLNLIPVNPWEWRDTRLWSLSAPDVVGIRRVSGSEPPLDLGYEFVTERWSAIAGGEDRSVELDPERANHLLDHLLNLRVRNWLRRDHAVAAEALARPTLVFTVLAKSYDESGSLAGVARRDLTIAAVPTGNTVLCYGSITGEPNPFLLSPEDVSFLEQDLFDSP